jgi:hypothetical protein
MRESFVPVAALPDVLNWWPKQKIINPSSTSCIRRAEHATDPFEHNRFLDRQWMYYGRVLKNGLPSNTLPSRLESPVEARIVILAQLQMGHSPGFSTPSGSFSGFCGSVIFRPRPKTIVPSYFACQTIGRRLGAAAGKATDHSYSTFILK